MRNQLGYVKYILAEFTPYTQEFAKIDAVANICTQIATIHGFEYGKEFGVGELGIDANGMQIVKIDFQDEETAMLVRLRGLKNTKGNII